MQSVFLMRRSTPLMGAIKEGTCTDEQKGGTYSPNFRPFGDISLDRNFPTVWPQTQHRLSPPLELGLLRLPLYVPTLFRSRHVCGLPDIPLLIMDYSCTLQQDPGSSLGREFKGFHVEDDDEYFAEIRRRILQLVVEDEEDESFLGHGHYSSVNPYKEDLNLLAPPMLMPGIHFSRIESKGDVSFPATHSNPKNGNGSGTGVFIPHASPRRRVCSGLCPEPPIRQSALSSFLFQ